MGELAKIVRWAAPGAVFALVLLGTFSALKTAALFIGIYSVQRGEAISPVAWPDFSVGAVAAGAVPAGFLVYQFYFHRYNNASPVADFVHQDVGQQVLMSTARHQGAVSRCGPDCHYRHGPSYTLVAGRLTALRQPRSRAWLRWVCLAAMFPFRRMKVNTLEPEGSGRWTPEEKHAAMRCYYWHRARNWVTMQGIEYAREAENPNKLVSEADRLSEIYHTLGAAREATFAAAGLGISGFWIWLWAWSRTDANPRPWKVFSGVDVWDKGAILMVLLLLLFNLVLIMLVVWCTSVLHGNRRDALARQATLVLRIIVWADEDAKKGDGASVPYNADAVTPLLHLGAK